MADVAANESKLAPSSSTRSSKTLLRSAFSSRSNPDRGDGATARGPFHGSILKDDLLIDFDLFKSVYASSARDVESFLEQQPNSPEEDVPVVETKQRTRCCFIHPFNPFRIRWDLLIIMFLCYNGAAIPFRLGFDVTERVDVLFVLDRLVDALFMTDIVLNFITGVVTSSGSVETNPRAIFRTYFFGWFLIDLLASLPYELIIIILVGDDSEVAFRAPLLLRSARILRMFKLLKLLRLLRLKSIFSRFEKSFVVSHSISSVAKYFVFIVFVAHWFACLFYYVSSLTDGRMRWIEQLPVAVDEAGVPTKFLIDDTLANKYVAAFYWSLTTITTIGYGDVVALGSGERLVAIFAMIVGSSVYAYGLTHVITMVTGMNETKRGFRRTMDHINTYMHYRGLPRDLQADIRTFMYEKYGETDGLNLLLGERKVLEELSPSLRMKVALIVNKAVIENVPFFWGCSGRFVMDVIMCLTPEYYPPREYIMKEREPADRFFVISKGDVRLLKWNHFTVKELTNGAYFGELPMISSSRVRLRVLAAQSLTYCDIRSLRYQSLARCLDKHPRMRSRVESELQSTALRRKRQLSRQCREFHKQDMLAETRFLQSHTGSAVSRDNFVASDKLEINELGPESQSRSRQGSTFDLIGMSQRSWHGRRDTMPPDMDAHLGTMSAGGSGGGAADGDNQDESKDGGRVRLQRRSSASAILSTPRLSSPDAAPGQRRGTGQSFSAGLAGSGEGGGGGEGGEGGEGGGGVGGGEGGGDPSGAGPNPSSASSVASLPRHDDIQELLQLLRDLKAQSAGARPRLDSMGTETTSPATKVRGTPRLDSLRARRSVDTPPDGHHGHWQTRGFAADMGGAGTTK